MRGAWILAALALASAPATAQSLRVENRVTVSAVPGGFSVPDGGGMGARGMWCAAGEYAARRAGAAETARVYVAVPRGRGFDRAPVVFTLDPAGLVPRPVLILGTSLTRAGSSLSVAHARSLCADFRLTGSR